MNTPALLQTIGRVPVLSRAARWFAGRFAEGSIIRIRHGHLAGCLWRRRHRYVHGYWIGHYEWPIQEALRRELRAGHTVFDLGANAGFFTLLAARLVGENGRCVAFEPNPANCDNIREQLGLNRFAQGRVVCKAISNRGGVADFQLSVLGSSIGRMSLPSALKDEPVSVKATTIDLACERHGRPDFIKMDIEGAEGRALEGAARTLREVRPTWLIELHGPVCERRVQSRLQDADYRFFDLSGRPVRPGEPLPQHVIARPGEKCS